MVNNNLVGGAKTILKNMSSSMGRIIPCIMENKKCLKPPTSHGISPCFMGILDGISVCCCMSYSVFDVRFSRKTWGLS